MNILRKSALICLALTFQLLFSSQLSARITSSDEYQFQYTEAELAQILAPIALYPDSLLTHIVIASTYPLEIVQAHRWREKNSHLSAARAVERAETQGWDPSIVALVAFPNILERLNNDLEWTQSLGEAFLSNEEAVLDSIQELRRHAQKANSFDQMENLRVVEVERQIIIEPVQRGVVYVPYYDTRVVYGNWRWHRHPPIFWDFRPHVSLSFSNRFSPRFHWSAGIHVKFNYFFGAFKWQNRHIVVTHHHHTRHYRSHDRIAISHGAKRWQHNRTHRRGVVYRNKHLNSRYTHAKVQRLNDQHRHHSFKESLNKNRSVYKHGVRDSKIARHSQSKDKHLTKVQFSKEKRSIETQVHRKEVQRYDKTKRTTNVKTREHTKQNSKRQKVVRQKGNTRNKEKKN